MSGIIIYGAYGRHFSFVAFDDGIYEAMRKDIISRQEEIVFRRGEVNLKQLDNARGKVADIVKKLNSGEKIDAENELSSCFN